MARRRETSPFLDWDAPRFLYELRKAGLTWEKVGEFAEGEAIKGGGCRQAIKRRWPRAEKAIAKALGIDPAIIWPSRYEREQKAAA